MDLVLQGKIEELRRVKVPTRLITRSILKKVYYFCITIPNKFLFLYLVSSFLSFS